ncbi:hypothetical protein AMTRI_Chr06g171540 [Amborella trichopoda]
MSTLFIFLGIIFTFFLSLVVWGRHGL